VSVHRAHAHAKVNLGLAVTGVRDDGFHTLRSVFLRLALHDTLEVRVDPDATTDTLALEGELEVAGDDLVLRAASHLRRTIDPALPMLRFRLWKRIPLAAGLGGGSSDAAAAIELSLRAWGVRVHPAQRLDLALGLGADVPFFVAGHAASLVEGVGEHLQPLPAPSPPAGLVLITPRQRLSTAAVFAAFDRLPRAEGVARACVDEIADLLREGVDAAMLAATCARLRDANDLWPAAAELSPELASARDAAARVLGRALLLTGSGSTLVAVYPSEAAAARALEALRAAAPAALDGATLSSTSTMSRGGVP
jgi:4-diphosphocytidyl-2-C-methyl-D-erythritol kinase